MPLRPDLVEAYVRAGRREEAEAVLAQLEPARSGRARRPRAAAGCSRPTRTCRGAFEAALALHDELPMPFETAPARSSRSGSGCGAPSSAPRRASR